MSVCIPRAQMPLSSRLTRWSIPSGPPAAQAASEMDQRAAPSQRRDTESRRGIASHSPRALLSLVAAVRKQIKCSISVWRFDVKDTGNRVKQVVVTYVLTGALTKACHIDVAMAH